MRWDPVEMGEFLNPAAYDRAELCYDDVEILAKAFSGVTMGQEVEQWDFMLPVRLRYRLARKGKTFYDHSGPLEWTYGPYVFPYQMLAAFFRDVKTDYWDWHAESGGRGCGSHWHFAPDPRLPDFDRLEAEYWTILWNTAVTLGYFLTPFMVWDRRFRDGGAHGVSYWAQPNTNRIGASGVREVLWRNPDRIYKFVTWNPAGTGMETPPKRKPLTVEMRAAETHPVISHVGQKLFQITIRRIFDKVKKFGVDVSPKLTERSEFWMRRMSEELITNNHQVYRALTNCGPFEFMPGRGIPIVGRKRDKIRFEDGFDVVRTLCEAEIGAEWPQYRYKNVYTRVLWLILNQGVPADEGWKIWEAYKGDEYFQWSTVPPFPVV